MKYESSKIIQNSNADLSRIVMSNACSKYYCFGNGYCITTQYACSFGYDINKCDPLNPPGAAHGAYPDTILNDLT